MVVRRSQSASIRHSSTSSQVSSSSVTTAASRKTISNPSLSIDKDKATSLPRWCSYFGKHNKNNNNKTSLLTAIMKRPATTSLLLTTSLLCMLLAFRTARAFTRPTLATIQQHNSHNHKKAATSATLRWASSSTMTTDTATNPFLQQDDLPKFDLLDPKDLTPAVESQLEKLQQDFSALESKLDETNDVQLDFDQVLPEVERIQFGLGYLWGVAGHLNGVKNGDELRQAYEANQPKIVKAMSQFSQSKPLYQALQNLQLPNDDESFETSQKRRAVELSLRSMTLGGVGLEGDAKERFNAIRMELASLSTSFSNNVLDATKEFSTTLTDPAQMDGVPASAKALWANAHEQFVNAENKKENESDEAVKIDPEQGPWRITLDMPSYIAVMSHMKDRAVREQVYKTYIQRASEATPDKNNVAAIYKILQLKQEMAKDLLGFDHYAQLSLASKMAPTVESVAELSDLIAAKALPAAEQELQELTAYAKEHGGDEYNNLEKLQPWDLTFWSERLKEAKFDLTEEETRPYFALPAVLEGMFALVTRIFNVQVTAADGETPVWHPDVRFFKVTDVDSGKHIASFFLDPYSRPENKRGGAWMDVCIGKSKAVNRDVAVAYLTCNGSPPVGDKPSLMTFREVETLFHGECEIYII